MARWDRIRARGTVQDRRGRSGAAIAGGGGVVGLLVALAFVLLSGGQDLGPLLEQVTAEAPQGASVDPGAFEGRDEYEVFAATVLGSNDELWGRIFEQSGLDYRAPTLVLFRTSTTSDCGGATSAVGPHYCPLDETIYLDETFFDELTRRFGAEGGDVAEAYVIAHEVGHHVQTLLGISEQVRTRRQELPRREANALSVAAELQADCFAGVWASTLVDDGVLLPGELQEATDAAAAVGDDRIQERVSGRVDPEAWTHGSSAQRREWLTRGIETGDPARCDTFGG